MVWRYPAQHRSAIQFMEWLSQDTVDPHLSSFLRDTRLACFLSCICKCSEILTMSTIVTLPHTHHIHMIVVLYAIAYLRPHHRVLLCLYVQAPQSTRLTCTSERDLTPRL
jgi:hypothetical protein